MQEAGKSEVLRPMPCFFFFFTQFRQHQVFFSSDDFGGGKLVHFPAFLPLPVGLPALSSACGSDLWEMPLGVLQETA